MRIHILDDWFDSLRHLPSFAQIADQEVTIWTDHIEDNSVLAKRLGNAEAIVLFRERTSFDAELLSQLPALKLISMRGAYPHVDVDACTKNGIALSSNLKKTQASLAAPEHCWALILAAAKNLLKQNQSLREGHWQMGIGKTLYGRKIGIYGYGRIGKIIAGYARAFGMDVVWWGSETGRNRAETDGENITASREEFFATCDVISLQTRLTPETKGIITSADLRLMREDAIFVNTARAGLVEEGALLDALNEGHPAMAALDVFDVEPITWKNDPLATHPNVIATPHIGFVTEDELELQFSDVFEQIAAFQNGEPINIINPEVLGA